MAVTDASFYRLEVHRPPYYIVIIRCLGRFDRIVEDIAVAMLGNLRMNHDDNSLEFLGGLRVSSRRPATAAHRTYSYT